MQAFAGGRGSVIARSYARLDALNPDGESTALIDHGSLHFVTLFSRLLTGSTQLSRR